MKKRLVTTAAMVSLFLGGTLIPAASAHAGKHGMFEKFKAALQQLDLSTGQQTQINAILNDAKTKMASAKGTGSAGTTNKALVKSIVKAAVEKVGTVLTAPQKTKLRQLMKSTKTA
jgi:hypothetical protein